MLIWRFTAFPVRLATGEVPVIAVGEGAGGGVEGDGESDGAAGGGRWESGRVVGGGTCTVKEAKWKIP
jgi:hypothetical protein